MNRECLWKKLERKKIQIEFKYVTKTSFATGVKLGAHMTGKSSFIKMCIIKARYGSLLYIFKQKGREQRLEPVKSLWWSFFSEKS